MGDCRCLGCFIACSGIRSCLSDFVREVLSHNGANMALFAHAGMDYCTKCLPGFATADVDRPSHDTLKQDEDNQIDGRSVSLNYAIKGIAKMSICHFPSLFHSGSSNEELALV